MHLIAEFDDVMGIVEVDTSITVDLPADSETGVPRWIRRHSNDRKVFLNCAHFWQLRAPVLHSSTSAINRCQWECTARMLKNMNYSQ